MRGRLALVDELGLVLDLLSKGLRILEGLLEDFDLGGSSLPQAFSSIILPFDAVDIEAGIAKLLGKSL